MKAWHFLNLQPDEETLEREKQVVAEEGRRGDERTARPDCARSRRNVKCKAAVPTQ